MNIYCPEGLLLDIATGEETFFKLHDFYIPEGSEPNDFDNIKVMTKEMSDDPDPEFFEAILVNSEKGVRDYAKFEKTLLYFSLTDMKLLHGHNFSRFNNVEGWFRPEEGSAIFDFIYKSNVDGINVEIGSWKGKSSTWMSYASKLKGNDLICIDHFIGSPEHTDLKKNGDTTFTEYVQNLKAFDLYENVLTIAATSQKAKKLVNGKIKFIFIDGNHNEFSNDLQYYEDLLVGGSIVAFHDCGPRGTSGITDYMYSLVDSGEYEFMGLFFSLGVIKKKESA